MKSIRHSVLLSALFVIVSPAVAGPEVQLGGVIGNRGILVIDGGRPQTLAVGARSKEGVTLVSIAGDTAVVEVHGRTQRLRMGDQPLALGSSANAGVGDSDEVRLFADARGHFATYGYINGVGQRFVVDTGATLVSIGAADAKRAGINYLAGTPATTMTANGTARVWIVRLDTVQLGGLKLHGVEAAVHESSLPVGLLGMSFLNRMEMRRDAGQLVLRKAY